MEVAIVFIFLYVTRLFFRMFMSFSITGHGCMLYGHLQVCLGTVT
jgi:hypothetical protein